MRGNDPASGAQKGNGAVIFHNINKKKRKKEEKSFIFQEESYISIIEKLKEAGVNLKGNKIEKASNKFEGLTFVVTGSFDGYTREEIAQIIENNSGKFSTSISKKTNYLVAGEEAGSKLKKANELGVEVITIDELMEMLNK